MKMLRMSLVIGVVSLTAAFTTPVRAAYLAFIEDGDVVVVQHDNNFECGFSSTANGEVAHADACWLTTSPVGYNGFAIAYMIEPSGSPNGGAISDEIQIHFTVDQGGTFNTAHMSVDFFSDGDTELPRFPAPGLPVLVEDGTPQFLNLVFFDPATGQLLPPPNNIEMRALSDVEPVPVAPSTWSGIKARY